MAHPLTFYDIVVAVHVVLVIFSFGVLFAYRWLPSGTPEAHQARVRLLSIVVERGALAAFVAGLYLAADAEVFGKVWVIVPLVCILAIGGVVGSVLIPNERRLAEAGLAPDQRPGLERAAGTAATACAGLVAIATFFMITKVGG